MRWSGSAPRNTNERSRRAGRRWSGSSALLSGAILTRRCNSGVNFDVIAVSIQSEDQARVCHLVLFLQHPCPGRAFPRPGCGFALSFLFVVRILRQQRYRQTLTISLGGDDVPVFMLAVIKKGDRDNLSKAECNALRKNCKELRMPTECQSKSQRLNHA